MNGTNGKQSDFPDVALVPYPVIVAATKGDPDAMKIVLQHFSGYIASLSIKTVSAVLGHSQTSTTLNIYAHAVQKQNTKALNIMADLLENNDEQRTP